MISWAWLTGILCPLKQPSWVYLNYSKEYNLFLFPAGLAAWKLNTNLQHNGNPLQYSCLENPMDGGAWWATVHGSQRVGHNWATSLSLYFHLCRHENLSLMFIYISTIETNNNRMTYIKGKNTFHSILYSHICLIFRSLNLGNFPAFSQHENRKFSLFSAIKITSIMKSTFTVEP